MLYRVIPCLLLSDRYLVKTVKFKNPKYIGDALNTVKIFNEKEVDELIILDITASKENKIPDFGFLKELAEECFMPICYGGGIKTFHDMERIFSLGIEKIALNSIALENIDIIKKAAGVFGSQSIVVSVDVKKNILGQYEIYSSSGKKIKIKLADYIKSIEENEAGEILLNSVDRDGTCRGYDKELIRSVAESVNIPLIACGGAGKLEDFKEAIFSGKASAAAAGSFFIFYGEHKAVLITYPGYNELVNLFQIT